MVAKGQKDIFYARTAALTVFLLCFLVLLVGRLFQLQIVQGKEYKLQAEDQHSSTRQLMATRGDIKIFDKQTGETFLVATNLKKPLVYAVPAEILDPLATAEKLSETLGLDEMELLEKFKLKDRKYVPLKKLLTDEEQERVKALALRGLYFDTEDTRVYPEQSLLSQTLGFVGYKDDKKTGLYGLERFFEKDLAGRQGLLVQERSAAGAWIFGAKRDYQPPVDGTSLILTIDKSIQFKAEQVIKRTVEEHQAESGSVVVVNPKTGAVLALANFPDYNPNEYNKVEDPKKYLNEAVVGSYEPGSIFKPLTLAAALNEGKISPETTYTDNGFVEIDNYTLKNSDEKANGVQTMTQVLEKSLNTGTIFAQQQIGNEKFLEYVRRFGFGKETGIELVEAKGSLDNLKGNIAVNYATASFGQGISATPMQLVQAFTSIANGGRMMKPYIVQAKVNPEGTLEQTSPHAVGDVISPTTANTVAAMMVNVVENGHGKKAAVPGFFIAGKTGTAQVSKKNGKGYEENMNIGSFVGFGPVENPIFLMLVRVDYPKNVKFAESTAAPAFGELAQFILHYYNIQATR